MVSHCSIVNNQFQKVINQNLQEKIEEDVSTHLVHTYRYIIIKSKIQTITLL